MCNRLGLLLAVLRFMCLRVSWLECAFPRPTERPRMKHAIPLLILALLGSPANAFEPSSDKLYIGWPDLAVDYIPGRETQVYAITTDNGEGVYVIIYNVQGRLQPLGAFACNERFEVLTSVSNGFRDIECVNNGRRAVLRADSSGAYLYSR